MFTQGEVSNSAATPRRPRGESGILEHEPDDGLLRRAAKGDEEAFTLLYRRHQAALYRFALRMTGSAWGAEEIVQDVFMTLLREPKKYQAERGALGAFLFGVARNKIFKYLEHLPREVSLEARSVDGAAPAREPRDVSTPATWTEMRERRDLVRAAVAELPVEFREAVMWCELEEKSYAEAAQLMGCPVGTVRSRLHRGRMLLLAKLEILQSAPRRLGVAR
ncbi:MAG: RNA polymerase sigma factor RpoE [Candidatus Acidiferrum sp.]